MSSRRTDNIEVLSEQLGSLQITNKTSDEVTERLDKVMFVAPVLMMMNTNRQATMLKSMVPDLGWFNRDRTKFKDWWRGI